MSASDFMSATFRLKLNSAVADGVTQEACTAATQNYESSARIYHIVQNC